ncbi:hypothetical protein FSC37_06025 [Piscinibacter aquaticus]|uniref:FAD-dependent oxidoreductase n=1 Tax=Piscinibacter aquaticus TaxID=392597 RepID=A0A5C6U236_9BURK|nr:hypothetical protein FSC37_06025 [Piscinibacter aquaticus]
MRMLQRMHSSNPPKRVAVVGAGLAGAAAASRLAEAGHAVQVFDKSRGPGGRLATRRAEWTDRQDAARTTRLDHGAPGFTVSDARFAAAVERGVEAGWLAPWSPTLAPASEPLPGHGPHFTVVPDLPRWSRELLSGIPCAWNAPIEGLLRGGGRWRLRSRGTVSSDEFDLVVLAIPPVQAAPLLIPHAPGWARTAAKVAMQPCWTLMGISEPMRRALEWDAARPPAGPIAWILRNETKPGRERREDEIHWVVHARAEWSEQRLEAPGTRCRTNSRRHSTNGWARRCAGSMPSCTAGDTRCRRWCRSSPHTCTGGTACRGWASAVISSAAAASRGHGCRAPPSPKRRWRHWPAVAGAAPPPVPTLRRRPHDAQHAWVSRQQGRAAQQALRGVRPPDELAPRLGEELGRGQVLLRPLPRCAGAHG